MKHDLKIWILIVVNVFTALAVLKTYARVQHVEDRLIDQAGGLHDISRGQTYIWHRVKGLPIRDSGPDEGTEIFWYDSAEKVEMKKQRLENKLSRK